MDKQPMTLTNPNETDRDQFVNTVKGLFEIEEVAKVIFFDNKKKMKQFNQRWTHSKEMTELRAITKAVEAVSAHDALSVELKSNMVKGIELCHVLIAKGEAIINQLSGLSPRPPQSLKWKSKKR